MATGRTVDSKIKAGGSTVQRIVAAGSEIYRVVVEGVVRYDRKDYVFSKASNYSYSAPVTGGTITLPSTAITSTYSGYNTSGTRVNGASASYAISPSSLSSNAGNTTQRTGTLTLVQDGSQLSLSVSYTQPKDEIDTEATQKIITGMTLSLSNPAVIPASGGSVNSCDVSVTAKGYEKYTWTSGFISCGSSITWALDIFLDRSDSTIAWNNYPPLTVSTTGNT